MSPLPLGIVAASGVSAGALELINTTVLANSSSVSFTFDNIPQTYRHLQIRYTVKSTGGSTMMLRINGSTGATAYSWSMLQGNGSVAQSNLTNSTNSILMQYAIGSGTVTDLYTPGIIEILDYTNTSKRPVTRIFYGYPETNDNNVALLTGMLLSNTATGSVTIQMVTNNPQRQLASGSRFSLYGIKG